METVEAVEASMKKVEASTDSLKGVEVKYNQWKFKEANGSKYWSAEASMEALTCHVHGSFH